VTGRIEKLWTKRAHRGPMDSVSEATLVAGQGMQGSVGRSRRRQVTLLTREAWATATGEVGRDPGPASRRANILVSGIELARTRGRVLLVGSCRISIGGELTPCERMDEAAPGLRRALEPNWRGGVFGEILVGGTVRVGDRVAWEVDSVNKQSPLSAAPSATNGGVNSSCFTGDDDA
jgi:MOSC domain-containing protein YiiM